jgi:hypothetical protein
METMIWKGKTLDTVGDLADTVFAIHRSGDKAEAERFMIEYRAVNPHADANVGYLSGYADVETMGVGSAPLRCEAPDLRLNHRNGPHPNLTEWGPEPSYRR